jgi:hypothetical protein
VDSDHPTKGIGLREHIPCTGGFHGFNENRARDESD